MADLFTEYGITRLVGQVLDVDDDGPATVHLDFHGRMTAVLDAAEARNLSAKLLDYADELDRQNEGRAG